MDYATFYNNTLKNILTDNSSVVKIDTDAYKFYNDMYQLTILIEKLPNGNFVIRYNDFVEIKDDVEMTLDNINTHIMFSLSAAVAMDNLNKTLEAIVPPCASN
ncbi:MAG TPA: hypothetical protein PKD00_03335 [Burkholderiales bacterium]|nr:hypothetical protein [Burkholderiales bacterium]